MSGEAALTPALRRWGRKLRRTLSRITSAPLPNASSWPVGAGGAENFDILAFFERDPKFAALLTHYRLRSRTSLDSYELASSAPRLKAPCRHGV